MSKNETINQIKKRSGAVVDFDLIKISNAITKAFISVGKKATQNEIDIIGNRVIDKLGEQGFSPERHPTVEDVQNFVESSLIDSGYPEVAKQYILYRAEHDKLREDKLKLLNTKSLDFVAKKFDIQCLKVLTSRYLFRNGKNEINEQPVQLFDRVALLVGISDMLYSSEVFDVKGTYTQDVDEANSYLKKLDNFDNKFHIGKFYLNKWHFRALITHYTTLAEQGRMKVSFKEILTNLATGKFDQYEDKINEYFNLMVSQDFLPNTPTLMNAGGRLGQLSACFVLDMQDNLGNIMKTAKDAALIFQCLGAGTLVSTKRGIIPIEQICKNDYVDTGKDFKRVEKTFVYKNVPTVKISTEVGIEVCGTKKHRLLVVDSKTGYEEWKRISEINIGDYIVSKFGHWKHDNIIYFDNFKYKYSQIPGVFKTKQVNLPIKLTPELAEFIGAYIGDGSQHSDGIRFTFNSQEHGLINRILELSQQLFGIQGVVYNDKTSQSVDVYIHSRIIKSWFKFIGVTDCKSKAEKARVPEFIFRASKDCVSSFLRGLFSTDGTIGISGHVTFNSASIKLITEVQQLLWYYGVPTSKNILRQKPLPYYGVRVCSKRGWKLFKQDIGFVQNTTKAERLYNIQETEMFNKNKFERYPVLTPLLKDWYSKLPLGERTNMRSYGRYLTSVGQQIMTYHSAQSLLAIRSDIPSDVKECVESDSFYVKVTDITEDKKQNVYDFTVVDKHCYIANCLMSHNSGGGVGINYSDLREEGDIVASTSGVASGPVSFMEIINTVTDVIKQGGKRRGANMGIVEVWHPDVEKFISRKQTPGVLENFNVSVGVWEDFWKAVTSDDGKYMLRSPRDHKPVKEINAHKLIDAIANSAHKSAEPGLIFFDNINKYNVFAKARGGPLRATNPCVTGDTFLATENGWIKIKDIVGTNTKIFYETGLPAEQPKSIMMTRPNEEVYLVELQNGMKIKCTKDHPLLTDHGMVNLKDLKVGDSIKLASFPSFGKNGSHNEGLLAGWIVSDGYFTGDRAVLDFYGEKKEIVKTFTNIINDVVPNGSGKRQQYIISPVAIQNRNLMSLSSTRLKVMLMNKFGMTAENKTMINDMLLQTSEEFQKGFLKSMFSADGTVNISDKSRASIKVGSISTELLRMVQLMLSNFGIKSTIYLRKKSGIRMLPDSNRVMKEYNCGDYYELHITAKSINIFVNKIGFIIESKTNKIKNYITTLTRGFYSDLQYTKIKSITKYGSEPVYDVIESPNHQIVLNGVITSNCGEQSLYPHESCNLGSINIANLVKRDADSSYEFDWQRYEEVIRKTTRFLDNVIDVNNYPIPEITKASKESRRIGLGVMGVADLLYKLKIPYNSAEGYEFQSHLSETLTYFSMDESITLSRERGEFPLYSKTEYPEGKIPVSGYYEKDIHYDWDALIAKIQEHGIRNVLTTTVAPTGTLSMLADCSSGMEPNFALSFEKQVTVGKFFYTNKVLRESLEEAGIYSEELLEKIANNYGSVKGLDEVPKEIQKVFVTAMDIHWADHLMAQGVWQDWIGNAIAKTINMPHDGTSEDVKAAYLLAHDLGLKGITVYRDGSREKQVLHMSDKNAKRMFDIVPSDVLHEFIKSHKNEYVKKQILDAVTKVSLELPKTDGADFSMHDATQKPENEENDCPTCNAKLCFKEGCCVCIECGYSGCASG